MYWMASPTVTIFSASSSGIWMSKCSSSAMTSSTVSRESAPRSSMNLAFGVTSSSSTPSCSMMISFTFSSTAFAMKRSPPQTNELRALDRLDVEAPVDVEHLARDVGAPLSGEESYHFRYLARRSHAPQRHLGEQGLAGLAGEGGGHVGVDEPGGDGVDQDRPVGELASGGLGEPDESGLGRRVVGLAGIPHGARGGGDVDDAPTALLADHDLGHRTGHEERAPEVHVHHGVP